MKALTIEEKIEQAHYMADEQDIEQLAADRVDTAESTKKVDGHYLRILIASMQAQFGAPHTKRSRRMTAPDIQQHTSHLAAVHERFYPAVMRGVTTQELQDDEKLTAEVRRERARLRNSRAAFARSAASTLKSFIAAGGDIRLLTVDTATKSGLRTWVAERQHPDGDPTVQRIVNSLNRIESTLRRYATIEPGAARIAAEECVERLDNMLKELPNVPKQKIPAVVQSTVFQQFHREGVPAGT